MTKHRSVVTGWDPAKVNPDGSTGRPKGVQTAADMRIHSTFDVLAEGIFAHKGVPAITGSPTGNATISPFMAAIAAPAGGFYVLSIDAAETFSINMANVGAVKVYVQQQDYQVDPTHVDSNVVIGVVYGGNPIPYNSQLLFSTTITNQTSTSGLTFTPEFKFTGSASGFVRVPLFADLSRVALIQTGIRALVTGGAQAGEYFYASNAWNASTIANPKLDAVLLNNFNADGSYKDGTIEFADLKLSTFALRSVRAFSGGNYPSAGNTRMRLENVILTRGSGITIDTTNRCFVIGAGVSAVKIHSTVMAEQLTSYLYTFIAKNGVDAGANNLTGPMNGFAGGAPSLVMPVVQGDIISIQHDCTGQIRGTQSNCYIEVVA